jgi:hypothetical protein
MRQEFGERGHGRGWIIGCLYEPRLRIGACCARQESLHKSLLACQPGLQALDLLLLGEHEGFELVEPGSGGIGKQRNCEKGESKDRVSHRETHLVAGIGN